MEWTAALAILLMYLVAQYLDWQMTLRQRPSRFVKASRLIHIAWPSFWRQ